MFMATYLANRSPHSTLEGATPYSKMHNLEPDLTGLRAIGARAFVHRETYIKKLEDRAFERKLCGQPQQQGVPHLQSGQRYGRGEPERHLPGNAGIHSTSGCHDGRLPLRGRRSSVHVGVRLISPGGGPLHPELRPLISGARRTSPMPTTRGAQTQQD